MVERYLYRGKQLENGVWIIGYLVHDDLIRPVDSGCALGTFNMSTNGDFTCSVNRIDAKTIGQCTGMKDKIGTFIFEGDIIQVNNDKCDDWKQSDNIHKVYWSKHWNSFAYNAINWICSTPLYKDYCKRVKVIDNIWDTPNYFAIKKDK